MVTDLINFLCEIPVTLANFGVWLTSPLKAGIINQTPLELLGVAGVSVIVTIIGVHVVRLFVG